MENDKANVEQMFDAIAPRYDFLNHFLSMGIDKGWRKKVVKMLRVQGATNVLDVATGTGDLAIAIKKGVGAKVTGCDFSQNMIEVGRGKVLRDSLDIEFFREDVHHLSFADNSFDAVTCAFGARNFRDIELGLTQMRRVLEFGGKCYILEFSKVPSGSVWGFVYGLYFRKILPVLGRWISGDKGAYSYLPASVDGFVCGEQFLELMRSVGFKNCERRPLMGGVATIYSGQNL